MAAGKKIAVVLFNLGGPTSLAAVEPFLFNLFNDKAIISAPQPIRHVLAKLISKKRAPIAREIYELLGGKSPLLENTESQARALQKKLSGLGEVKTFIAMRYWQPFSDETAMAVKAFDPDQVVLLPLYPQFSTTTTGSSLANWRRAAKKVGLLAKTSSICCYPLHNRFLKAHAEALKPWLKKAGKNTRVLFTAHGLPEKIVKAGDPYQWQVEQTVKGILSHLGTAVPDSVICYQSRVGPLKWIGPSTDGEIYRAGGQGKNLVVVPVAFVSEHSETLVELDIEYKKLAMESGVKKYLRVPTLDTAPDFISCLADLVKGALDREGLSSFEGQRHCEGGFSKCPCAEKGV